MNLIKIMEVEDVRIGVWNMMNSFCFIPQPASTCPAISHIQVMIDKPSNLHSEGENEAIATLLKKITSGLVWLAPLTLFTEIKTTDYKYNPNTCSSANTWHLIKQTKKNVHIVANL